MRNSVFGKTISAFCFAALLAAFIAPTNACCSLYPAHFSGTTIYAGEATRDGVPVHVLGYQNSVVNRHEKGKGNAMLLPIPAKQGTMTAENIVDTSDCKNILKDIRRAVRPPNLTRGFALGAMPNKAAAPAVQVFAHDIYTIVLAQDAKSIPGALSQVPQEKRPSMNKAIFEAYARWYPGWTFALCCFNIRDEAKASPMLWWYEPSNPDELFCPALDAHDGKPPDLNQLVQVDHVLAAGSEQMKDTLPKIKKDNDESREITPEDYRALVSASRAGVSRVSYTDGDAIKPEVRNLLPKLVLGEVETGFKKNGDFVFLTKDVREGITKVIRKSPPGVVN